MSGLDLIPINPGDVTIHNFSQHLPAFKKSFSSFGQPGRALNNNVKSMPSLPQMYKLDSAGKKICTPKAGSAGTTIQQLESDYELVSDKSTLSKAGLSNFCFDRDLVQKLIHDYKDDERKLMSAILNK